jgi:hypothetical protein
MNILVAKAVCTEAASILAAVNQGVMPHLRLEPLAIMAGCNTAMPPDGYNA